MKVIIFIAAMIFVSMLVGCAGQTTDPRQGGLFSYNPDAYEQRLAEQRSRLAKIEAATSRENAKTGSLEATKSSQILQKKELESKLAKLMTSIAILDQELRSAELLTAEKEQERKRILHDLKELQQSVALADKEDDFGDKRLEIERLKKKRKALEDESILLLGL